MLLVHFYFSSNFHQNSWKNIPISIAGANSRTRLVNFGTKPNKKLTDWKDIKPIPIKIELTPIVNLFNPTNLDEKHNISSSDILDWFLPLYLKYCKVSSYPLTFPTFRIPHRGQNSKQFNITKYVSKFLIYDAKMLDKWVKSEKKFFVHCPFL